jgi:hypothetical protein
LKGIREDLLVSLDGVDVGGLLECWRWLIQDHFQPLFATALGDLFLADSDGSIWWLNMSDGQLLRVAANEDEFQRAAVDPENSSLWFGEVLVDQLRTVGKVLGPGECYCYLLLPMLGGQYEPTNFRVYDLVTHFQVWGPIHEQLRDIPNGTEFVFEIINRSKERTWSPSASPRGTHHVEGS